MAFPCENPEGRPWETFSDDDTSSQERDSHEAVEEGTEEMKPALFSADASSSQHKPLQENIHKKLPA